MGDATHRTLISMQNHKFCSISSAYVPSQAEQGTVPLPATSKLKVGLSRMQTYAFLISPGYVWISVLDEFNQLQNLRIVGTWLSSGASLRTEAILERCFRFSGFCEGKKSLKCSTTCKL